MTSDPSVEFTTASQPAPVWAADAEPLDPNWSPPAGSEDAEHPGYWTPPPPGAPHEALGERPSRPPRHWRLGPRSLTGRLVAGVVTLVVFLVLATGIGTFFALRSFLYNRLDQQLIAISSQNAAYLQSKLCLPTSCFRQGPPPAQEEWLGLIAPPTISLEVGSPIHALTLTSAQQAVLTAHPNAPRTITVGLTQLRVRAVPINSGTYVITGLSTAEVQRTLHRLIVLEWIIGSGAILIAFGATTYGVRFSLRRLYGVTRTARDVATELSPEGAGLDRRVPVDGSDTTEVGQLADSMNTLLAAVETQFAARLAHEEQMRQFLADASHELRTPLTSIRGYAELARMQRAQGGADSAENLARIEAEGTRMSRLVDDLLTLARSDQGAAPLREWLDIADLLDEAVSGVRAAYPARQIDVGVPPGLGVVGDRDQLVRVVRNLVTNAAVHTRPDGPISVTAASDGAWATIRIADGGPGLPPEEAAHVFERFWRADKSRARARGGSGLGLAIVASIVQAHGGNVRFDSTVERGSVVTVSLPIGTN